MSGRDNRRRDALGVILFALFPVTAQHLFGFSNKALCLADAFPQGNLACLDLCCLLLSPLSALFGV